MATLYIAILLVLFFLPAITNKSNKKSDTRIDVKIENSPKKRAKHKKQDTDSEIYISSKRLIKRLKKVTHSKVFPLNIMNGLIRMKS